MKTILIIEDDARVIEIYQKALIQDAMNIVAVPTVEQGFGELQKSVPDVIILDIMLPGGKNGFDFLEVIKKDPRYSAIPVLVMTNLDTEEHMAKEIGADDYIVKANMSIDRVVEKIRKYLA